MGSVAREYWFDVLIVLLAIEGMLEVVVGRDSPGAPTLWFALPAIAILVSPIFARRRFPFAAPATYWLLGAGISLVNWWVLPAAHSLFVVGMAVAFLLGNLRDDLRAGIGLAVIVGSAVTLDYQIPDHTTAELVFIPMDFGISWLAGFAVRERAVKAEAAEERATVAERERDAAARIAVAEERARIARELHDVVAHAVSVMVLQTGAVTSDGLGHGLVGIRERVKIYGGEMSAGTENGGGFVLRTRLPVG